MGCGGFGECAAAWVGCEGMDRHALEALAVEGYRSRRLTQFQVEQILGLSRIENEDFLARHVDLYDYSAEELEREAEMLQRLWRGDRSAGEITS